MLRSWSRQLVVFFLDRLKRSLTAAGGWYFVLINRAVGDLAPVLFSLLEHAKPAGNGWPHLLASRESKGQDDERTRAEMVSWQPITFEVSIKLVHRSKEFSNVRRKHQAA
ncbi:MAG: hypothetical protein SFU86_00235 [Pirellulaceae bacterium]|nr:hypothetical protein [Pirellulaceae bacterium]